MNKELVALMTRNGFVLVRKTRHMVWKRPDGAMVTTSLTPSDRRALQNIERDIKAENRRLGVTTAA